MPGPIVQIAQLLTPADGGGSNYRLMAFDWPRGRLYGFGLYAQRKYKIAVETQLPIWSVVDTTTAVWTFGADIDPLTGNIIAQRAPGAGLTNAQPIRRYDPDTFAQTGSFGAVTSYPNWPDSVWAGEWLVCVTCGTLASGGVSQVCYALLKYSEFSGAVAVIRTDTMQQAGFYQDVVAGSTDNRGFMCRGASGPAGASAFLTWSTTSPGPNLPVYAVTIAPGAETYNSASWPATNPYIQHHTVGNITGPMVDPTWTKIAANSIGYDTIDGNILMIVQTNDTAAVVKNYLIKVSSVTGAVLWATAFPNPLSLPMLSLYGIDDHNIIGLISSTAYGSAASPTGVLSVLNTLGGLSLNPLPGSGGGWPSLSDNTGHLFFAAVGNYDGTAANAPVAVDGTPNHFVNSLAWIYIIPAAKLALDNIFVQRPAGDFSLIYRWRSRQFYLPAPASLGACQVSLNSMVTKHVPDVMLVPPLDASDPLTVLPPGVNAVFRLYVGPKGRTLLFEKVLDQPRMIFRLPSGRKAFNWQFEVVARVPIHSVELASTMRELKGV